MRPSARVHGDVEKGASQLNVKGMKQWPIIGRIRDTNSKNFYSRPGPDDEATYPLESWDQEFVSIQFADDMTDSYFSDAQQLEVEEVINIESGEILKLIARDIAYWGISHSSILASCI